MTNYTKDSIQVFDSIKQVRHNPSMYVGGVDSLAYHHIFREIFDNSLDEGLAGHATRVVITLDADGKGITVEDDGRGIPFEKHSQTGLSTLATVFTINGSSGKFDNMAYSTSIGLHGIGATATNALSEVFEATSYRDGKKAYIKFCSGLFSKETPDAIVSKSEKKSKTGTIIHFRPDTTLFKGVAGFDADLISSRLQDTSALIPNFKIEFLRTPTSEPEVYQTKAGLVSILNKKSPEGFCTNPLSSKIKIKTFIKTSDKEAVAEADLAIGWGNPEGEADLSGFVNLAYTPEHGTHVAGLEKGISRALMHLAKDKCSWAELSRGLKAVIHLKHPGPVFSTQTKNKLTNPDLTASIADAVEAQVLKWAKSNREWVDQFIAESIALYDMKMSEKDLKKALKGLKKVKRSSRGVLPSKLYEADCSPWDRELFLVEGDSALGSCVEARDASYQEVLALRGKVVNVLRTDLSEALANKEISNIITAIGGGVGPSFDLKKCRVSKVLLLADGDVDGAHISSLLITFFTEYMGPLVADGRLYLVDSPLFQASVRGKDVRYYAHTMDQLKAKAGKDFSKCDITRLKGHGEANANAVEEYAMNPKSRKLIQVTVDESSRKLIHDIMADDVIARKKLLGL